MFVYDYKIDEENIDYFLENEDELEEFLTSNLTINEATELEIGLRGE